jgi:hypothetical protein
VFQIKTQVEKLFFFDLCYIFTGNYFSCISSQSYNLELSQCRAEAVRNALLSRGVAIHRIVSKGYGKSYPVATNDTEAGRQQNRRVEIIILDPGVKAETKMR